METLVGVCKTINLIFFLEGGVLLTVELARNHICSPLSPYILEETEAEILQINLVLFNEWILIFIRAKIKNN
jgi:hypothetical protein